MFHLALTIAGAILILIVGFYAITLLFVGGVAVWIWINVQMERVQVFFSKISGRDGKE
jgi:hypothetical protein